MIIARPWAGTPRQWIVVFDRKAATPWMNLLPIGKYKHVRAFGYVPEAKAYIFFDDALDRMSLSMACDEAAQRLMMEWLAQADAIAMPVRPRTATAPRLGIGCVRSVKHLIGLRGGALRPDALWRDCLANGGEIVANEGSSTAADQHSGGPAAATAGTASAG